MLGWSEQDGELKERDFPTWLTIPSYRDLATGRRWHLFFAWFLVFNGIAYLIYGLVAGHFRRDLVPDRDQLDVAMVVLSGPFNNLRSMVTGWFAAPSEGASS